MLMLGCLLDSTVEADILESLECVMGISDHAA